MKLLDIYIEKAGTRLELGMRPNADVVTYLVFVRRFTSAGPLPEATWFPEDLETTGCSLVLGHERGYDITLKATVRPGGHAVIDPLLVIHDTAGTRYTDRIVLPEVEGPVVERGWTIAIK
jgi:hypothetical protein